MMRLSTRGRYGARVMLELALNYGRGPVFLKCIAKKQDLSEGYLEHLVSPLKTAGLINSLRGSRGGYMLGKHPSEITLRDVIQVLEGTLSPAECVEAPSLCRKVSTCVTRDIWEELGNKISETLAAVSLRDMVEMHKNKEKKALSYSI